MARDDTDSYVHELNKRDTILKRKQAVEEGKVTNCNFYLLNYLDNWNERYQAIISQNADSEEAGLHKDVQLLELIGEFKETAAESAQNIIDTYHTKKMFKDGMDEGDRYPFGSRKYVPKVYEKGIVFQLACDYHGILFYY